MLIARGRLLSSPSHSCHLIQYIHTVLLIPRQAAIRRARCYAGRHPPCVRGPVGERRGQDCTRVEGGRGPGEDGGGVGAVGYACGLGAWAVAWLGHFVVLTAIFLQDLLGMRGLKERCFYL